MDNQSNVIKETPPAVSVVTQTAKRSFPYVDEHIVWIRRVNRKSPLPVKDLTYNPAEDYIHKIGSSFKSGTTLPLGLFVLTEEEKERLMPELIGVNKTHNEWNSRLKKYWENISVNVPFEGLELNCSVQHEAEGKSKPVNSFHYILYKYCLEYSGVANHEDLVGKSNKIKFYIWSAKEQKKKDVFARRVKDEALMARINLQSDEVKMNSILYLFNADVSKDKEENRLRLAELVDVRPDEFLVFSKDENLLTKAMIKRCINNNLLAQPPGSTMIGYEGDIIANNIDEAVIWLKDIKNSQAKVILETKLREKEA